MSRVQVRSHAESAGFWPRLAGKSAVALMVCLAVRMLWAQAPAPAGAHGVPEAVDSRGYKVLSPFPTLWQDGKPNPKQRDAYANVKRTLNGEQSFAEGRALLENYYNLYYFPRLTQTLDNELKNLGNERQNFLRDLENAKSTEAHNLLTSLVLTRLTPIVRDDKFHPAVRYNAMLIISSLNDKEFVRGGTQTPVPMLRALRVILEEFKRPENSDAIRLAALLGLSRHLEWENEKPASEPAMDAGLRQEIVKELVALAQAKEPPLGRSKDGHVWLRRRAVEALGNAALRKPDAEIAAALDALLKDDAQPVPLRCTVASTIGRITYQAPVKVDPQAMAKELGYLALVATDAELYRVSTQKKDEQEHAMRLMGQIPDPNMTASGGMPGGGGYGAMPGGYGGEGSAGGFMPPQGIRGTPGGPGGIAAPGTTDGGYGAGGYGTPGAGYDPSMGDPKYYRFDPVRRRMRQQLYCVQLGLTGGEDLKTSTTKAPPAGSPAAAALAAAKSDRGMWVVAKAGTPEKKYVEDVYGGVRKLAEIIETKAIDLPQLDKDLRKEMKNLETLIGKKLIPAGSQTPAATAVATDDVPGAVALPAGKAAAPQGKAAPPAGKAAAPAPPGKASPAPPAGAPRPGPMPPPKAAAAVGK